jgi:hypothetical protein
MIKVDIKNQNNKYLKIEGVTFFLYVFTQASEHYSRAGLDIITFSLCVLVFLL